MAENKVEIKITADAAQAVQGVGQVGGALDTLPGKQTAVGTAAAQSGAAQAQSSQKARDGIESVAGQLDNLKGQLLGLVGIGVGTQAIKDLAQLSDSYKNLEARIKLTTGEGQAFDAAFQGVFDVAKRTSSAVEETGLLFTKLAEAGKTLGVSNVEALKLTETINQSIQLSGASADASKAAILQLVQGLQSGVLRGDEFNSVMEQSPRLAKALGDGLGVTTGELRKMAEEGKLTSATVIGSLQKQADVIQGEFGKLPQTVGRSMQNLTTEFTKFIGETDKAHGYSTTLAKGIELLSANLSTVATVMIHAGQAFGAYKALNLAADFLGFNQAVQASTVSTTQNTVATGANTAAKAGNALAAAEQAASTGAAARGQQLATSSSAAHTVATNANTAALAANAVAGRAGAAAQTAGTASAGIFGGAVSALSRVLLPLAALDIALNVKSYGTAIGEAVAKMVGYKDRSEELLQLDKDMAAQAEELAAARKKQAQADNDAADARFGLTKRGAELVANFDELIVKGDSASEAIGKIGKDFNLASLPGIRDAAGVLDKLVNDGKISAQQFQSAWANALKGEDLAAFEVKARAALSGTAREAERLAQILDGSTREAIRRTGLDFDVISGGMGKAAKSAINDTDTIIVGLARLKAQGVDTGQALAASIGKGLATADSLKAIEAVKAQIESLRAVLGNKVTDGLLDQAKQKANELTDALNNGKVGVNSLREAMQTLGLKTREELQASATKATEAYGVIKTAGAQEGESYVAWQARKAAAATALIQKLIEANGGIATEAIKSRAAVEGLELSVDGAGKATVRAMSDGAEAVGRVTSAAGGASAAVGGIGQSAQASTAEMQALADAIDKVNSKYGQGKADSKGKYDAPSTDPKKTADGFEKNAEGAANGSFTNQVDMSAAFALVAKDKAGTLKAEDLDSAKAAFQQATNALNYIQTRAKDSPGGVSSAALQSTQALYNGALAAYEKVQALARNGGKGSFNAPPGQAPAPAPGSAPAVSPAAPSPAPAAPAAPAPSSPAAPPAPSPSRDTTYIVKLDFGGGRATNVNVNSAGDAASLIDALGQAKRAAVG